MKLTILNKGTKKYPYFVIKDGHKEFCSTRDLSTARAIVNIFNNIQTIEKIDEDNDFLTMDALIEKIINITHIDLRINFSHEPHVVNARTIFCKICRDYNFTTTNIGRMINRDHSSVCANIKKFNNFYETDKSFRELYHKINDK